MTRWHPAAVVGLGGLLPSLESPIPEWYNGCGCESACEESDVPPDVVVPVRLVDLVGLASGVSMANAPIRILLTGAPGSGKTTAIRKIVDALDRKRKVAGFYTEEIREAGTRVGFRWHRLDGRTGTLAHINIKGPHRVSKYAVDLESFDREAVSVLNPKADVDAFVVDEIGKMECFSTEFVAAIRRLLSSDKSILATIAEKGSGLIREVKSYPGVELVHLTRDNRDEMVQEVAKRFLSSDR